MADTTRNSVQGLFFKAEETSPRLVTVPLETDYVGDDFSGDQLEVKMPILPPFLGPSGQWPYDSLSIQTRGWHGPPLEQPFRLFIRDNFLNDGSLRNLIPSTLTDGRAPHRWAGNLLALKQQGVENESWVDCTMEDVATLARYFEWYGDRQIHQQDMSEELAQLQELFPGSNWLVVDLSGEQGVDVFNVGERVDPERSD